MRLPLIELGLALLWFSQATAADQTLVRYEASHNAMATDYTIVAYGKDRDYLAEVINEAFEQIDRLDAQMSNYKPESELSRINREAYGHAVLVEPGLFRLIQDAICYGEETHGAFDITVGPLMKAWGFFQGPGRRPPQAELAEILGHVGYRHVKLDAASRTLKFDQQGIELDLGGIAKGYAVDQAVEILRENHVGSALVSSGTSSIYALGAPPGERGWKVTLRDPFEAKKVGDVVFLRNYSMSTSANYERSFRIGGKTYGHIMNPRTGMPVEDTLTTAVLAPSTRQSDALTKPAFVLGVTGMQPYLQTHANLTVMFYLPSNREKGYRRIVSRSASYSVNDGALAEIAGEP
jgi:thiamine biosynthesis lipoprotein